METTIELPFDRLPAGVHPVALELFGRGASALPDEAVAVTLTVAGQLLWTHTFQGAVELDDVRVALPQTLVRHRMAITVRAARLGRGIGCAQAGALAFDLRDTTRVVLGAGYVQPTDFASVAMASDRSALVRIDGTPASAVASIPLLARMLASAGARPGAIDVAGHEMPLDRPFIVLADVPPFDIAQGAPIRPDLGRVVLQRPGENVQVVLADTGRLTTIQLAVAGTVPGIWLSPGAASTLSPPPALTDGDVAILDGVSPTPIVFDTRVPGTIAERVVQPTQAAPIYTLAAIGLALIALLAAAVWFMRARIVRLRWPRLVGLARRRPQSPPAEAGPPNASDLADGRAQHRSHIVE